MYTSPKAPLPSGLTTLYWLTCVTRLVLASRCICAFSVLLALRVFLEEACRASASCSVCTCCIDMRRSDVTEARRPWCDWNELMSYASWKMEPRRPAALADA